MRTLLGKKVNIENGTIQYENIKKELKSTFETKEPIIEEVIEEVVDESIKEDKISIEDKIVDEALKRLGL